MRCAVCSCPCWKPFGTRPSDATRTSVRAAMPRVSGCGPAKNCAFAFPAGNIFITATRSSRIWRGKNWSISPPFPATRIASSTPPAARQCRKRHTQQIPMRQTRRSRSCRRGCCQCWIAATSGTSGACAARCISRAPVVTWGARMETAMADQAAAAAERACSTWLTKKHAVG